MKILIIEDEELAAIRLKQLLLKEIPDALIDGPFDTVKSSVRHLLGQNDYDLIFLDIQLADGKCFSIFEQVPIRNPVIFTTAYDEFAIKAFELNSVDYLLKPINSAKLHQALEKFHQMKEAFRRDDNSKLFEDLLMKVKGEKTVFMSRFLVSKGNALIPVGIQDAAYFAAEDKVVVLVCRDGQKHIINFSLDELEQKTDPAEFFRVNRQFLVSIHSIRKVHYYFNYKLKIELNPAYEEEVIVSRSKSADFKSWMSR
jgi:DNA-binding LytR/AlgR family response regulator